MKIITSRKFDVRLGLLVVGGLMLAGGTFAVTSGQVAMSPTSLLAAVYSSMSGKPVVYITKDASSPSGTIKTGGNRVLAVFNISAKNVTRSANLNSIRVEIPRTGKAAAKLNLSNIYATYSYCISSGATYGYGYKGGNCSTVKTIQATYPVTGTLEASNTYKLEFLLNTPVYPQQSRGTLTVYARPAYSLGGVASDSASVRVAVTGGQVTGEQCGSYKSVPKGNHTEAFLKNYGYSKCVPVSGSVSPASGNTLQVQRSYGYGYCLI